MTMITSNNNDTNFNVDHIEDVFEEQNQDYFDFFASKPHRVHSHRDHMPRASSNDNVNNFNIFSTISPVISLDYPENITNNSILHRTARSLNEHAITHSQCRRSNIIGELVTDASQFLFPCTIEYSLICAAILYIMWKGQRSVIEEVPEGYLKLLFFCLPTAENKTKRAPIRRHPPWCIKNIITKWIVLKPTKASSPEYFSW